jgi:hypothetical protein
MSLFKARDWWQTKPQSEVDVEEFDKGCMCIANIDNDPKGTRKLYCNNDLNYRSKNNYRKFLWIFKNIQPWQERVPSGGSPTRTTTRCSNSSNIIRKIFFVSQSFFKSNHTVILVI